MLSISDVFAQNSVKLNNNADLKLDAPEPTETWELTADIEYLGEAASGEAYVYLSEEHTSIEKPYIVIEGIDLDNTMNWEELYGLMNQENLLEDLRTEGYDIIVLNFEESTDYIQRNAFLVLKLIHEVNAVCENSAVLIGASMGGLTARYALLYMESIGEGYNIRSFISFDVPHKGANIPLGLQFLFDFFSDISTDLADLRDRLQTPAAKQMLVYSFESTDGTAAACDPLFTEFYSELESMGSFPTGCRIVAISNGSGQATGQGFEAGDQLIEYEYNNTIVVTGNVWAVPEQTYSQIFEGYLYLITSTDELDVFTDNTLPYDNAPGGYRTSMADLAATGTGGFGEIIALHDNHSFISTISSLNIDTDDLFFDVSAEENIYNLTPFDTIYYPADNQLHVLITPESKEWFTYELELNSSADVRLEKKQEVNIFPNPCSDFLYVKSEPAQAEILNSNGQIVYSKYFNSKQNNKIDVSNFAKGVYFIKISNNNFTTVKKLMKY